MGLKLKNQTVKLFEISELVCCFCRCRPVFLIRGYRVKGGGGGFTVLTGGGQGDIETTFGWGYTPSVCYGMRKICIIAQFSLEILLIQYWELLLACPVVPDHIHRNRINQIDVSIMPNHMQKINFIPQLIFET